MVQSNKRIFHWHHLQKNERIVAAVRRDDKNKYFVKKFLKKMDQRLDEHVEHDRTVLKIKVVFHLRSTTLIHCQFRTDRKERFIILFFIVIIVVSIG